MARRTPSKTMSDALKISEHHMTAGLNDAVAAFERRDRDMVTRIEEALGEDEGRRVLELLVNEGFVKP